MDILQQTIMTTFTINNTLWDIDTMITHEPPMLTRQPAFSDSDLLKPPMLTRQPAFSDSDLLTSKRVIIIKNAS